MSSTLFEARGLTPLSAFARQLGVHPLTVYRWQRAALFDAINVMIGDFALILDGFVLAGG